MNNLSEELDKLPNKAIADIEAIIASMPDNKDKLKLMIALAELKSSQRTAKIEVEAYLADREQSKADPSVVIHSISLGVCVTCLFFIILVSLA